MALTVACTTSVVAGIPALIGYVPDDSLVLLTALARDNGSLTTGPVMRADLAHLVQDTEDCVVQFARQFADLPVECVTGIVVREPEDDTVADSLPLRDRVDAVVELLADHGFTDLDIVHVGAIADGARWRSYLHPDRTGVLPDPATTALAAAAAVKGRTIAARRDDIAARYTPAPEHVRARLQPLIGAAVDGAGIDGHRPAAAQSRLDRADAAIRAASEGNLPTDEAVIVELAATFATSPFFDVLIAVEDRNLHLGAESLVLHLWRHACDPVASQLAAVIAMHAYQRGDGTSARIALETADPEQPLPRLLLTMLDHAVPPPDIQRAAQQISRDGRRTLTGEPAADQT
jgi:hypothetical protein